MTILNKERHNKNNDNMFNVLCIFYFYENVNTRIKSENKNVYCIAHPFYSNVQNIHLKLLYLYSPNR